MPASLPAGFVAALGRDLITPDLWLEVEGIASAFGLADHPGSFFAARAADSQRTGVLGLMQAVPRGVEQEIHPLDGDSSIGRLTLTLVDDDAGSVIALFSGTARVDGRLALGADLAASAADLASVTYTGAADAALYPNTGGTFYVGRETFTYATRIAGTFQTVKRARYRVPGQGDLFAHTAGDEVTPFARYLRTRRAALYLTLDGTDAGKILRWLGTVSDVRAERGLCAFTFDLDSVETMLRAPVFSGQIRAKLAVGIADANGEYSGSEGDVVDVGDPIAGIVVKVDPTSLQGRTWVEGQRIAFKLGDEYFAGITRVGGGFDNQVHVLASRGEGRGCFNTAWASHAVGDELVEVMVLAARDAAGAPEFRAPYFTSGHPLDLVRALFCSRLGDGANGADDILPFGGIGLDAALLDGTGIAALRDGWLPGARHIEALEEPVAFKEWTARSLRPFACYFAQRAAGQLTVRRINPPIPGQALRVLDATAILGPAGWEAQLARAFGRVIVRADNDPSGEAGEFRTTFRLEIPESQERYAGDFREHVVDAKGQWTGLASAPSVFGPGYQTNAEDFAYRLLDVIRARFSHPWPLLTVEADITALDIEGGDLVALSVDHAPNISSGARGLAGVICEVRRRVPDEARGVVTFTLEQTGYKRGGARYLAPCATVRSTTNLASVAVNDRDFGAAGAYDVSDFPVAAGTRIAVWSPSLKTKRGAAVVTGVTVGAGICALALAGAISVTAGDVVMLDDWATQPQAVRDLHAFLADGATALFTDAVAAHVFAN